MLKLKLQYFGHLMWRSDSLGKTLMLGKIERKMQEKGTTEEEMVGWHHRLNGYEFEQALGVSDGQGGLVCCSPWGCKESDTTKQLNWADWIINGWWVLSKVFLHLLRLSYGFYLSIQFSYSVGSTSLKPHGLQHARLPRPSPTPGAYSNSSPLSQWHHPTISSSVVPFSSRLQSFPATGSFQMNQFFASGGQSIAVSASTSVLPVNIQDWFPLGWTGWISLQSKELSRVFSNTTVQKHQSLSTQPSL